METEKAPQSIVGLQDALEVYLRAIKNYINQLKIFMDLVESALPAGSNQITLFEEFTKAANRCWQTMPRTIFDVRLRTKSPAQIKEYLDSIYQSAEKAVFSTWRFYAAFIKDCLVNLDKEVKALYSEIASRNISTDARIDRELSHAKQMILDMARRLKESDAGVPRFDEVWIGVTEALHEIKSLWKEIGVPGRTTHLEVYVGFPISEPWTPHTRNIFFQQKRGERPSFSDDEGID